MAKIVSIEITQHQLPLDPPFLPSWSSKPRTKFDATIVRVTADTGHVGIGSGDYMLGFTGTALTDSALGATGTRRDPVALQNYLDGIRATSLDVDGDTRVDALTDGLLILRYMLGIRGTALLAGAANPAGSRTTVTAVEAFLGPLTP